VAATRDQFVCLVEWFALPVNAGALWDDLSPEARQRLYQKTVRNLEQMQRQMQEIEPPLTDDEMLSFAQAARERMRQDEQLVWAYTELFGPYLLDTIGDEE
jgi:hypothetical protein